MDLHQLFSQKITILLNSFKKSRTSFNAHSKRGFSVTIFYILYN